MAKPNAPIQDLSIQGQFGLHNSLLGVGGHPVQCGTFSSTPGLYPLNASGSFLSSCEKQKYL